MLIGAAAALAAAPQRAAAQEVALAWDQVQYFRYNILNVSYDSGTRTAMVVFSVTNPQAGNTPYEILGPAAAAPFKPPATLRVNFSWHAGDWAAPELVNTKDAPLLPLIRTVSPTGVVSGAAPASAVAVNALSAAAKRCSEAGSPCAFVPDAALTYWVKVGASHRGLGAWTSGYRRSSIDSDQRRSSEPGLCKRARHECVP